MDGSPEPREDGGPSGPPGRSDAGLVLPPADVTVELPHGGEATELVQVAAAPRRMDVHFSVDTTRSFDEEIDAMQDGLTDLMDALDAEVPEVSFGVSRFEDFPVEPHGVEGDRPFELLTAITSSRAAVTRGVADLDRPLGVGGDVPEAGYEALYQIATGEGRDAPFPLEPFDGRAARGGGTLGGVGFRQDALHVVVHVTDAPSHSPFSYGSRVPDTHSLGQTVEALDAIEAKMVGIASRRPDAASPARPHLESLALATGAVLPSDDDRCPTGIDGADNPSVDGVCPLVFDVADDGTGLGEAIVDGLLSLLATVAYDEVHGSVDDDRLAFVRAVEATSASPPAGAPEPDRVDRHPAGDGVLDTFVQVATGTELTFAIHLRNDTIPSEDYDQVFRVRVAIHGDGVVLAEPVVRVVVPARAPDAGADGSGDGGSAQ
ncbi:MAG: hypothetical protein ACOC9O_02480 [Myxococcota bacterium]